jgi:transposase-like protein
MENFKRKNHRHGDSEKQRVVDLYEQGLGYKVISRELEISSAVVQTWLRVYRKKGISGFVKQPFKVLSVELKESVVRDVLNNLLSFPSVALKYGISPSSA